ncbi:MAG: tetratricopeptide repeat protein [Cyclobacteriaceae bacterium]
MQPKPILCKVLVFHYKIIRRLSAILEALFIDLEYKISMPNRKIKLINRSLLITYLMILGIKGFSHDIKHRYAFDQLNNTDSVNFLQLPDTVNSLSYFDKKENETNFHRTSVYAEVLEDSLEKAKKWVFLGDSYLEKQKYTEAIAYLDSARRYFFIKKDSIYLNIIYNNLGVVYDYLGDYSQALNMYYKSLEVLKNSDDVESIVIAYNNIGLIYFSQKKYDEALKFYQKGIEISEAHHLNTNLSYVFHNLAELHFEKGDHQEALRFFKKSLDIDYELNDKEGISLNLYLTAKVYLALNEIELAKEYLDKSFDIQKGIGDKIGMANTLYLLGSLWYLKGDYPKGYDYTKKSLDLALALGTKLEISNAAEQLSQLYRAQNDYKNALLYNDLYHAYKDSIENEDLNRQSALMQMQKQAAETSLLEIENELKANMLDDQQLLIEKQTYLVIFISFGLIVSVVVLSLLFNANEDKYKTNQQLLRQKAEIEKIIDELTNLNENINEQKNELEKSNHVKDKLLSIVSHDFRSPLNSLEGMLDLVAEGNLSEKETKMIASELRIKVNVTTGLLDNLLNWAKNQMQGIEVHPEDFNIQTLTLDTIYLLNIQAERKKIKLICQLKEPINVHADYEMIKLVVRNLIANAIKFSEPGSEVKIDARPEDNKLLKFVVKDSGTGIPEEELGKLFTSESRSVMGTANEKGTGLGLQLCRDFVELNGGSIWAESQLGIGSKFMFTVPLAMEKNINCGQV